MNSWFNRAGLRGRVTQFRNGSRGNLRSRDHALAKSGSEFLYVAVPKVVAAVAQLVLNLLLVRELGPELSGVVFVCITTILLGDAILGSAQDVAVIRLTTGGPTADTPSVLEVQQSSIVLKLALCMFLGIPVFLWARFLSRVLFNTEGYWHLLPISVGALFGLLLLRSVQTRFQVSGAFALYGLTDLLHSCVKVGGIGLMLALEKVTPASVLAIYFAGPLSVSLLMLCTASRDILRARMSSGTLGRLFNLFRWYAGGAAAGALTSRMDLLLVSAFAGSLQAGLFSAAQIFTVPFQLLGMYLGIVFAPRIMPLWEQGRLLPVYLRFQMAVIAFSLICYAVALAGMPIVSAWLLPAPFHGTAVLVLVLLPSSLTALVNFPWTVSFLMFSHPRFLLLFDACALVVLGLIYWQSIIRHGALGAAVVTSVFALLKTAVLQLVAAGTLKRTPGEVDSRVPFVAAAPSLVR